MLLFAAYALVAVVAAAALYVWLVRGGLDEWASYAKVSKSLISKQLRG